MFIASDYDISSILILPVLLYLILWTPIDIFNLFSVVLYSLEKIWYYSLENPLFFPILWIRNGWEVTSEEKIATLQIAGWGKSYSLFLFSIWLSENQTALCSRVGWFVHSCRLFSKLWLDYLCRSKLRSVAKCLALFETLIILAVNKACPPMVKLYKKLNRL
jgi:hypothetical protein